MIETSHRHLKAALRAQPLPQHWTSSLHMVLLGKRTALKVDLKWTMLNLSMELAYAYKETFSLHPSHFSQQIQLLTVGDKTKFPLCTNSPLTCERSCQQKSPKSRPKVASYFRRTLNVINKVADLFLSGEKIVCARIQFRLKSLACANGTRRSCNFAY